jgi:hypothetical protein
VLVLASAGCRLDGTRARECHLGGLESWWSFPGRVGVPDAIVLAAGIVLQQIRFTLTGYRDEMTAPRHQHAA